ncbi:MAG TPA: PA0069 family radical SAM protein [Kofleriaceae bacterium]|nr:PA0069 family radical SAM protein [Kofleriaceae bacterium]
MKPARPPDEGDEWIGDASTGVKKGRGATSNQGGRFEPTRRVGFHDGWDSEATDEESRVDTIVTTEKTTTIIATNDSPDVPFDQSINPYKGCEHGCIYCFARPTHAYLGLSPGLDFETRITAKPEAAAALRKELAKPSYQCRVMAMGTNTDPYQPTEKKLGITRAILEVLAEHDHPVGIVTKNAGILRDLDILAPMAKKRLATVMLSITSLDPELASVMEPRASRPARRLHAIEQLTAAGVPCGVLASPMIPAINDGELEKILEAAYAAGARHAGWILVRLPLEIKHLFEEWLRAHFPDRAERVLDLIKQTRGGKLYDSTWGTRMSGTGPYAALIDKRFDVACARLGFDATERFPLDTTQFKKPAKDPRQLPLFP